MPFMGKLLGFVFGFLLLKLPGAILGLIAGHMFDKGMSNDFSRSGGFGRFFADNERLQSSAIFFHALFACLGHIAKADGAVTQSEINVALKLMDDMQLNENDRREAQQAFREGKDPQFPLEHILKDLKHDLHGQRIILQAFLEMLIEASFADGQLSVSEVEVLDKVAVGLGFGHKDLDRLIRKFEAELRFRQRQDAFSQARDEARSRAQEQANAWRDKAQQQYTRAPQYSDKQRLTDAYRILNVAPTADEKTLKRAYKKAMNEHHPDKLIAKGLPKQAMELAKVKAQDIQAAYELIKSTRP
ncbi:MAG TPA: co-chaperone DjlA [Glaciecola sp.]|nr:co-chaperone DjlA [Glaciecola sp.]